MRKALKITALIRKRAESGVNLWHVCAPRLGTTDTHTHTSRLVRMARARHKYRECRKHTPHRPVQISHSRGTGRSEAFRSIRLNKVFVRGRYGSPGFQGGHSYISGVVDNMKGGWRNEAPIPNRCRFGAEEQRQGWMEQFFEITSFPGMQQRAHKIPLICNEVNHS